MTAPPPWRLRCFAVLPSTQDLCRRLAEAGEPGHLAILADRQTRGRGTQGRSWSSPPGNLALSALLRPDTPVRQTGQYALLAAVALAEATARWLPPGAPLQLKWPNDLLLGGRKLAGILSESATGCRATVDWLVIGFGVNLAQAPAVGDRPTASLAEWAAPPPADRFAADLLAELELWRRRWTAEGFAPVRAAWLAHAPEPGRPVSLRRATGSVTGVFAGLGEGGDLLLHTDGGLRRFGFGEISCCS